ncbi:MAG: effector-associated domain EAD1-containing protein [Chloroflexota bacterium]
MTSIRKIRSDLAAIYTSESRIYMFTVDSELKTSGINFNGAPDEVWQAVLDEAKSQGKIGNMVDILQDDYPNQRGLIADLQAWEMTLKETALEKDIARGTNKSNDISQESVTANPPDPSQATSPSPQVNTGVNTEAIQSLTKLTGPQVGALEQALKRAFNEARLQRMVRIELDQTLEEITGGDTYTDKVFSLITWAESTGKLGALIQGALNANPDNPDLNAFVGSLSVDQSSVRQ